MDYEQLKKLLHLYMYAIPHTFDAHFRYPPQFREGLHQSVFCSAVLFLKNNPRCLGLLFFYALEASQFSYKLHLVYYRFLPV